MTSSLMLAADYRAIGVTLGVLFLLGFALAFVRNILQSREELGSELELAANKKPYLSDEELEGPKLDKALGFALVVLGITAILLPFYWLAEPGRQEGAVAAYQLNFESRGEGVYINTAQCVNCHAAGGVGGSAPYVLQDADGQFIGNATWMAPALNNLFLRYNEEEVTYILNYGRPGSPMAAWGTPGGGPLTAYQVQNVVEYIQTFQVQSLDPIDISEVGGSGMDDPESQAAAEAAAELSDAIVEEVQRSLDQGEFSTIGEAVFNLGYFSGYGAGSLSCGRCHTAGWSLGPSVNHPGGDPLAEGIAACGGGYPSGIGYSLCGDITSRFPNDTWKNPDGSWTPEGGNVDTADGSFYFESMEGDIIAINDSGQPVTADGEVYEILEGTDEHPEQDGDLALCAWISGLWEPGGIAADAYAFDPTHQFTLDEATGQFVDPPELTLADAGEGAIQFVDRRIGVDCEVTEMPERTSYAHYNFIYNGADSGSGYGDGGMSGAGMMPGFGKLLPPQLIQAVVDYERGLS
ncbi:MAG: c-type cytochrome [Acidimicrobiales bacterium]